MRMKKGSHKIMSKIWELFLLKTNLKTRLLFQWKIKKIKNLGLLKECWIYSIPQLLSSIVDQIK